MKLPEQVLRRPLLTEKGTLLAEKDNQIRFEVALDANKIDVRRAVEKIYSVRVASVNTQVIYGKEKRVGRSVGKRSKWKKAIVTLAEGSSIDFFAPDASE